MRLSTMGKYDVKVPAMAPPSEYPMSEKRSEPVQQIGDDVKTSRIWDVNSFMS